MVSEKLQAVKNALLPDYGYIVFEFADASPQLIATFKTFIDKMLQSETGFLGWERHSDDDTTEQLLVVKIDPSHHYRFLDKLLNLKLSDDVRFFIYGSRL